MKNFDTSARRGDPAVNNPIDIPFEIDGEELIAHPPTTGQLALFIRSQSGGGAGFVQGLFDFLSSILDDEGVDIVNEKLQEGVELTLISDIISYLIEEWSDRPTEPSSESSTSPRSTGKRSTASKRPAAKKRSASRSTAS